MTVRFCAYIDEAGDTGLESVKPHNPTGASEWLVLSCFLVRVENDPRTVGWVKDIQSRFRNVRSPHLHFSSLNSTKKMIACDVLATKPCRVFIIASNKKNIEHYRNPRIGDGSKAWLYWFLSRLLLERVTKFCDDRARAAGIDDATLRITFSKRGGLHYSDFVNYMRKIRAQSSVKRLKLDAGDLAWSLIDFDEILVLPHEQRAGLQLADIGASAFFQALERNRPADCTPEYAYALSPIMGRQDRSSSVFGFGLKTMPNPHEMRLSPEQQQIFEMFGYLKVGWRAPGS